jgi:hypothetical protein
MRRLAKKRKIEFKNTVAIKEYNTSSRERLDLLTNDVSPIIAMKDNEYFIKSTILILIAAIVEF